MGCGDNYKQGIARLQEVLVASFTAPALRISENPQTPVMAASFPD
jgi:hypothetical protein